VPGAAWRSDAGPDESFDDGRPLDGGWPELPRVSALEAMTEAVQRFTVSAVDTSAVATERETGRHAGAGLRAPLRSRGLLFGVVDIVRGAARGEFTRDEIDLVVEVSTRCALALDHALLLRSEQESREQLLKFKALADASDDLIGISDDEGHIVYTNPRVGDYLLDLSDHDAFAATAAAVGEPVSNDIRRGLEEAGRWSGDLSLRQGDRELVGHVDAFRIFHPDTHASLGAAWIGRDVTELRNAEAALRSANADLKQFKALVEASPDFIAIAGLDGNVKYVNPGGRRLIGMDPDVDVTTTTIPDYLTAEGLEASLEQEQPAVIANGHWEGESTLRSYQGPPIPVAISSFLIRDIETGEPFARATVQRDISERLAAETAVRELADQRQALLARLVDAQDEERARIAADVHDDPVQALASVDLRLGLLKRRLGERRTTRQGGFTLGLTAKPVPLRRGPRERPPQPRRVRGLDREHLPAREGGLDLRPGHAAYDGPHARRLELEHQQRRTGVGKRTDTPTRGNTLLGAQVLEAAGVQEEVERAKVCASQVCHVAHHEGGAGAAHAVGRFDGARDVVDAHGLPPPPRELVGLLAAAAAEIDRPTERARPLTLLPVQQGRDTRRSGPSIALPRSEPETVGEGVSGPHPCHRLTSPTSRVRLARRGALPHHSTERNR